MDQPAVEAYLTRIRAAGDAEMKPCGLVTPAFISTPSHRVGVAHLFLRPRFLLADPTGTGKTPQTLVAYGYLKEKDPRLKMLVVTTMSAQFQWERNTHKFLTGVTARVFGYDGLTKLSPRQRQQDFLKTAHDTAVWMTTYAMMAKEESFLLQYLDNFVLVLDEGHVLKSHKGEVLYPAAERFSHKARCSWALTATPMKTDRLPELYSVFRVIRPGTFPDDYRQFRKTYYILKLVRPRWKDKKTGAPAKPFYEEVGYQNLDHLQAKIAPFHLKRTAEQLSAGLPPTLLVEVDVFLEKKQQDVYDAVIADGKQTKQTLAAFTKAQQVLDAPSVVGRADVPSAKWEELKRRLQGEHSGEKVLVYSRFAEVVGWLSSQMTAANIIHGRITGSDTLKARDAAVQRFQTDPKFNVLLLTDAGGEALDLQAARIVVLYDLPWTWGNLKQVVGRAVRRGSVHANVVIELLVAHTSNPKTLTIDEHILEILHREETNLNQILETESILHQQQHHSPQLYQSLIPIHHIQSTIQHQVFGGSL